MVAMVGILAQSFVRFPGFPPFPVSNPARPLAVFERMCAAEGNAVILTLLCIGVVELTIGRQARKTYGRAEVVTARVWKTGQSWAGAHSTSACVPDTRSRGIRACYHAFR